MQEFNNTVLTHVDFFRIDPRTLQGQLTDIPTLSTNHEYLKIKRCSQVSILHYSLYQFKFSINIFKNRITR